MAKTYQKVIIIGNLGADPEVRYTQNSVAIANLNVATSETWKDKQTGEQKELTEWHRIVCYRNLAEIAGEYLKKGSKVFIEGRLQTRKWQDQQGQDRYTTEIVANEMQMLDSRSGSDDNSNQSQGGYQSNQGGNTQGGGYQKNQGGSPHGRGAPQQHGGQNQQQQRPATQAQAAPMSYEYDPNDVPF